MKTNSALITPQLTDKQSIHLNLLSTTCNSINDIDHSLDMSSPDLTPSPSMQPIPTCPSPGPKSVSNLFVKHGLKSKQPSIVTALAQQQGPQQKSKDKDFRANSNTNNNLPIVAKPLVKSAIPSAYQSAAENDSCYLGSPDFDHLLPDQTSSKAKKLFNSKSTKVDLNENDSLSKQSRSKYSDSIKLKKKVQQNAIVKILAERLLNQNLNMYDDCRIGIDEKMKNYSKSSYEELGHVPVDVVLRRNKNEANPGPGTNHNDDQQQGVNVDEQDQDESDSDNDQLNSILFGADLDSDSEAECKSQQSEENNHRDQKLITDAENDNVMSLNSASDDSDADAEGSDNGNSSSVSDDDDDEDAIEKTVNSKQEEDHDVEQINCLSDQESKYQDPISPNSNQDSVRNDKTVLKNDIPKHNDKDYRNINMDQKQTLIQQQSSMDIDQCDLVSNISESAKEHDNVSEINHNDKFNQNLESEQSKPAEIEIPDGYDQDTLLAMGFPIELVEAKFAKQKSEKEAEANDVADLKKDSDEAVADADATEKVEAAVIDTDDSNKEVIQVETGTEGESDEKQKEDNMPKLGVLISDEISQFQNSSDVPKESEEKNDTSDVKMSKPDPESEVEPLSSRQPVTSEVLKCGQIPTLLESYESDHVNLPEDKLKIDLSPLASKSKSTTPLTKEQYEKRKMKALQRLLTHSLSNRDMESDESLSDIIVNALTLKDKVYFTEQEYELHEFTNWFQSLGNGVTMQALQKVLKIRLQDYVNQPLFNNQSNTSYNSTSKLSLYSKHNSQQNNSNTNWTLLHPSHFLIHKLLQQKINAHNAINDSASALHYLKLYCVNLSTVLGSTSPAVGQAWEEFVDEIDEHLLLEKVKEYCQEESEEEHRRSLEMSSEDLLMRLGVREEEMKWIGECAKKLRMDSDVINNVLNGQAGPENFYDSEDQYLTKFQFAQCGGGGSDFVNININSMSSNVDILLAIINRKRSSTTLEGSYDMISDISNNKFKDSVTGKLNHSYLQSERRIALLKTQYAYSRCYDKNHPYWLGLMLKKEI